MKYRPMLAESASKELLSMLLSSDVWVAEQKLDGHRVIFVIIDGVAYALNRKGEPFKQSMSAEVIAELSNPEVFLKGQTWVFDGEYLNGVYYVFDLLDTPMPGGDVTARFVDRRAMLEGIFRAWAPHTVVLVGQATTAHGKADLLRRVEEIGGEGVMFKDRYAPYLPGRQPTILKYKLWESADVIITGLHPEGKRSVKVAAFGGEDVDGELVGLGTVTMSDRNLALSAPGRVIEVKYLYRGAQGALYQPSFLRFRTDKDPYECTVNQLRPVCKDVLTSSSFTPQPKGNHP